jgi:hypothetical protein
MVKMYVLYTNSSDRCGCLSLYLSIYLATIEKASVDGQQNFYKSLDAAVRKYLTTLAGESKRSTQGKKKGGRRKHKHRHNHNQDTQAIAAAAASTDSKHHFIIEALSSTLDWLLSNASIPNTSQLTAICLALLVFTNLYIASKMAGVDKQLHRLNQGGRTSNFYQHHHFDLDDNENSLWSLLGKLDPDVRKQDLKFAQDPLPENDVQYQNHNSNSESDEQLELSKLAKTKLDRQMIELERMIQKAGQSMEQVTQVVQNQRQRILDPNRNQ